jgi:hypothetical protein
LAHNRIGDDGAVALAQCLGNFALDQEQVTFLLTIFDGKLGTSYGQKAPFL